MLNIAIVDDNEKSCQELKEFVEKCLDDSGREYSVRCFRSGLELIVNFQSYDLLFLDIKMEKMDGMETASLVRKLDENVLIVFVTAMAQYAISGYKVDALDFILKPADMFSMQYVLKKALKILDGRGRHNMLLKTNDGVEVIPAEEIYYVEIYDHDLIYHTKRGDYKVRGKLSDVMEQLNGAAFKTCSRSHLVNLKYVDSVHRDSVILNGCRLPLSRARRREFLQAFAKYMGGH